MSLKGSVSLSIPSAFMLSKSVNNKLISTKTASQKIRNSSLMPNNSKTYTLTFIQPKSATSNGSKKIPSQKSPKCASNGPKNFPCALQPIQDLYVQHMALGYATGFHTTPHISTACL